MAKKQQKRGSASKGKAYFGGKKKGTASPGKKKLPGKPAPTKASPNTPAKPAPGPPPAPAKVDPFFTAEDLAAIGEFNTRYSTDLANFDSVLNQQRIDTDFQKGENDKGAKAAQTETADQMAARGLFRSSIRDAAAYDIEAERSLANKFLDDKLTQATLDAGTQKQVLGQGKQAFDTAMKAKALENATGVNDANNAAWAEAMAAYVPPTPPKPATPVSPKPGKKQKLGTAGKTTVGLNPTKSPAKTPLKSGSFRQQRQYGGLGR